MTTASLIRPSACASYSAVTACWASADPRSRVGGPGSGGSGLTSVALAFTYQRRRLRALVACPGRKRRTVESRVNTTSRTAKSRTRSRKCPSSFITSPKETGTLRTCWAGKGATGRAIHSRDLPVPPGFTSTTEACRYYLEHGSTPEGLDSEIQDHLTKLETAMGRKLGDPADPLLVSVRSGAKFSMPGMMETVLNIGLSDESVQGLAKQAGNERFAWDSYRRLLQMFGKTVLDLEGEHFEHAIDEAKQAKGVRNDLDLDANDLQNLVEAFKGIIKTQAGLDFPQGPKEQLDLAIKAVFNSWNADRAILYRRQERIPADLGTAVNVVTMVFGNLGMDSGTGVAFTRDPGTGAQGVYGDYLQNAQGEDVVAGIRNTVPLQDLESIDKASYDQLMQIMRTLENHYRDLCDIEFTIERGKLWMLQTRVGKRTAAAAFRIAMQVGQ